MIASYTCMSVIVGIFAIIYIVHNNNLKIATMVITMSEYIMCIHYLFLMKRKIIHEYMYCMDRKHASTKHKNNTPYKMCKTSTIAKSLEVKGISYIRLALVARELVSGSPPTLCLSPFVLTEQHYTQSV